MEIDWQNVRKILVIRLRSIGDTVLSTPSLIALRRFLPDAQIDILLEDWVAPVLEGFQEINNVLKVSKDTSSRFETARQIRRNGYDLVFNLHGGTTSTFFTRFSGAKYRIGFQNYRYNFLYTNLLSSPLEFWNQEFMHSAEQQLTLLGFVGVPVEKKTKSRLTVSVEAEKSVETKLKSEIRNPKFKFALIHPVAAFDTKQWETENFARIAEYLSKQDLQIVAVATKKERDVLEKLKQLSNVSISTFDDLTLPKITALASRAEIFVGNDSGIAHIAAAVNTPSVVIFGSSNRNHWRPWTDAPSEIVYENFPCQPCAGYYCKEFPEPRCILSVKTESVIKAIQRVLEIEK